MALPSLVFKTFIHLFKLVYSNTYWHFALPSSCRHIFWAMLFTPCTSSLGLPNPTEEVSVKLFGMSGACRRPTVCSTVQCRRHTGAGARGRAGASGGNTGNTVLLKIWGRSNTGQLGISRRSNTWQLCIWGRSNTSNSWVSGKASTNDSCVSMDALTWQLCIWAGKALTHESCVSGDT